MKVSKTKKKSTYFLKRRRNALGKKMRKKYESGKVKLTMKETRDWIVVEQNYSNTLTSVLLDNLLVEYKEQR